MEIKLTDRDIADLLYRDDIFFRELFYEKMSMRIGNTKTL